MKYLFILFLLILSAYSKLWANDSLKIITLEEKLNKYHSEIQKYKSLDFEAVHKELKELKSQQLNEIATKYSTTNDQLENYLSYTTYISGIFGLIIALAGIYLGFAGLKSNQRREEAIKTLEEAKEYTKSKKDKLDKDIKSKFDNLNKTIQSKLDEIEKEHNKFLILIKDRLLAEIEAETQKIKFVATQKAEEIEGYSISEKSGKELEFLQKRLEFLESIGIPEDPQILNSKAKILSEKGMHIEAIELLEKQIEIEEENASTHWDIAWQYSKLSKYEKTIEHYTKSLELKPEQSAAHNNLGVAFRNIDKPYDAIKQYNKAVELDPKSILYNRNRARTLRVLDSKEEAIEAYLLLINLEPTNNENYDEVILYLNKENCIQDTINILTLAIENNPNESINYELSLALAHKKLENYDTAINLFQKLIDSNYESDNCYHEIAGIKYLQGNKDESLKIIDDAISSNPKFSKHYYKKAALLINESSKLALDIIKEGAKHIDGESYYQQAGRYFNKIKQYNFAKSLYIESNKIIKEKNLSFKDEGIILDYYEGLIITQSFDDIDSFLESYSLPSPTPRFFVIKSFLDICLLFFKNETPVVLNDFNQLFTYLKSAEGVKLKWNTEDLVFSIIPVLNDEQYKLFNNAQKLINNDLTIEEFKKASA